ncbi:ATP-binding cassette domain-containing protein [Allostreptomyces psammosilenae]|uniref:ABC-type xenobiotic transporter n=1 Tax=Allostreptomyces psammosilenae TaxID=1892865 RepID=A0A853A5Q6_9ACTN|nr:ATP-binding cassette domain-containing protein [Allostreptomyces psammosilenae]NYI05822.1 oleandomycin transport system ATP-binding protein [Allostreptomyces psammosilenae]
MSDSTLTTAAGGPSGATSPPPVHACDPPGKAAAGPTARATTGARAGNAPAAVEVRGVVKTFGENRALDGVDLAVPTGSVLGLLGPNGAGKTTLVRILATLIKPDGGTATVAGYDVVRQAKQVRRSVGLTGQYASVDESLTGRDNLYLIARLLDFPRKAAWARADELLERFSLTEAAGRRAKNYSGGMRRRLDLAASLVGEPQVLYLDEPTTGLDPRTRGEVWDEVRRLVGTGTTVFLTTQYMEEAEALADAITVIDRGRVVAEGTVEELKDRVGGSVLRLRPTRPEELDAMAEALAGVGVTGAAIEPDRSLLTAPLTSDEQLTAVIGTLGARGFGIARIDTVRPTLDEVFLTLTGQRPHDAATPADGDGSEEERA